MDQSTSSLALGPGAADASLPNLNPAGAESNGSDLVGFSPEKLVIEANPKLESSRRHFRKTINSDSKHACVECTKAYCTNYDLEKHAAKTKHAAFRCGCDNGSTYSKLSALRRHITESEATGKYHCGLKYKDYNSTCRRNFKRLVHLKGHLQSGDHCLDKKAVDKLLKPYKLAAQKSGRSKGREKKAPPSIDVTNGAGPSNPPGTDMSRSHDVLDSTVEGQHCGSKTPSSSVLSTADSVECGATTTLDQFDTSSVGHLAFGCQNPTAGADDLTYGTEIIGTTSATCMTSGFDASPSYPAPSSFMGFGDAAVPTRHGIHSAPAQPLANAGYTHNSSYGSHLASQYMTPGCGSNVMGPTIVNGMPTGFAQNTYQPPATPQFYPGGATSSYFNSSTIAAPITGNWSQPTNWAQTMSNTFPSMHSTCMPLAFSADTFSTGVNAFTSAAVPDFSTHDTFAAGNAQLFPVPATSGTIEDPHGANAGMGDFDGLSFFDEWNGSTDL